MIKKFCIVASGMIGGIVQAYSENSIIGLCIAGIFYFIAYTCFDHWFEEK